MRWHLIQKSTSEGIITKLITHKPEADSHWSVTHKVINVYKWFKWFLSEQIVVLLNGATSRTPGTKHTKISPFCTAPACSTVAQSTAEHVVVDGTFIYCGLFEARTPRSAWVSQQLSTKETEYQEIKLEVAFSQREATVWAGDWQETWINKDNCAQTCSHWHLEKLGINCEIN